MEYSLAIATALAAGSAEARVAALERYFCTGSGDPRARLMIEAGQDRVPRSRTRGQLGADAILRAERAAQGARRDGRDAVAAVPRRRRAAALHAGKSRRAALDYEDLIVKTVSLLHDKQATAWVLFKLDRGIDHILVDEAQDTSPEQWQVIEALAEEFFSGHGQREEPRTLFAVGDEKQSIYSFQGAAPHMFARDGPPLRRAAQGRDAALAAASRSICRSAPSRPSLGAVDRVFADAARTPGLTAEAAEIRHAVHRLGHGGLIEVWPTVTLDAGEPADAWSPLDDDASTAPGDPPGGSHRDDDQALAR